jgi:hypothetical protein
MPTPTFSSIRRWLLRVGLYELQRQRTYRTDWIFILDLTIELGPAKCLVILGLPQVRWEQIVQQGQRGLQHRDVEVLGLDILPSSHGEVIEQSIRQLSDQVGVPRQIISDHGSDLKKGIELYLADHPQVIYTYDVTHWLALQLKAELAPDERYQAFVQQCHQCRAQLQQTKLAGLMPPSQRTKARYLNVGCLVNWAQKILRYQQGNDFSLLSTAFTLDAQALNALAPALAPSLHTRLCQFPGHPYETQETFTAALNEHLGAALSPTEAALICQVASVGRRRFEQKLGWVQDYQADLDTYAQMVELTHRLERQLKRHGLNAESRNTFIDHPNLSQLAPRPQRFYENILTYLATESRNLPPSQSLLATSDIIESIFGKYKLFSAKSCLKEIGPMILTLPLCTIDITTAVVKQALETIRGIDVENWLHKNLGKSSLSNRKRMFNQKDTEVA